MMSNIVDYALLNANKDFNTLPFSKIDALIFSQLAYLNFDGIVPNLKSLAHGVTLSHIAEHENYENLFPLERTAELNKKLLNAVAYSKRYGKIKLDFYQNVLDDEKDTQFSAVTFIINNDLAVIAFRGTDATFTGWKENCHMLYDDKPVGSQVLSVPYIDKVAHKVRGKIILTGHSKGGNLAIYAGTMCHDKTRTAIKKIYSFDSPGFTESFINSPIYKKTERKIEKFVPQESLVGMMLNNSKKFYVVQCDGVGVNQHSPYMWLIEDNDFIIIDKIITKSVVFDGTFNEWIQKFEPEQRELFIETVFNIIEKTNEQNATTFKQWGDNLKDNTDILLDALNDLDFETKAFLLKVFGKLFTSATDNMVATQKQKFKSQLKRIPRLKNAENKE